MWLLIMSFNITVTHAQRESISSLKDNSLQCVQKFPLGENKASFLNVYQDTINNYVMFKTIRYYGKNFSEIGTIPMFKLEAQFVKSVNCAFKQ